MSDLTPRDDLAALLAKHETFARRDPDQYSIVHSYGCQGCDWDVDVERQMYDDDVRAALAGHVADVLLAAGWVKTPEPAWEWGVQLWDGQVVPRTSRESAEEYAEWRATGGDRVGVVRRATTAGPWEVVGE